MYGYGYNSYSYDSGASNAAGALLLLMLVGFIAAIVLTVILYKKYAKDETQQGFKLGDKATWGPFLKFETLIIDGIIKVLYIFTALNTAFIFAAVVLSSIFAGFAAFLISLIFCAILLVICELLIRVAYEQTMLSVVVARNTTAIKKHLCGDDPSDPAPAFPAPAAPEPVAPVAAQPATKCCPSCGATNDAGSKFCYKCGQSL